MNIFSFFSIRTNIFFEASKSKAQSEIIKNCVHLFLIINHDDASVWKKKKYCAKTLFSKLLESVFARYFFEWNLSEASSWQNRRKIQLLALNQRSLHAHRISAKQKPPDRKMEGSLSRAEVERRLHLIEFPPSSRSLVPLSLTYICASLGKKPLLAGKSDLFVNGRRYRRVVKFRMEIGFQRTGTARILVRERAAHLCASAASTSSSSSSLSFSLSPLSRQVRVSCRNKNDRFPPVALVYFYGWHVESSLGRKGFANKSLAVY